MKDDCNYYGDNLAALLKIKYRINLSSSSLRILLPELSFKVYSSVYASMVYVFGKQVLLLEFIQW